MSEEKKKRKSRNAWKAVRERDCHCPYCWRLCGSPFTPFSAYLSRLFLFANFYFVFKKIKHIRPLQRHLCC